jgi:hypothetical protein
LAAMRGAEDKEASMENVGSGPQFQYIVTTTSRPPEGLAGDQRVRLESNGAPVEVRLLGRDS